jgi:methionyl-tRNA formyltransferase
MRIIIITQNEPFYLSENLKYLIEILPKHSQVVGCVVTSVSPYGKKESFYQKARKSASIFGLFFFFKYSLKFIFRTITGRANIHSILNRLRIQPINLDHGINHPDSLLRIADYKPDLLISILGNEIFKKDLIELAPKGCLNLHTALLPKYRGLMPTFWVLRFNEKETGVSVFFVDEGIDSGPIVIQKRISINDDTQQNLIIRTKRLGMEAISEAVDLIERGEVTLISNDATKKTYYSFPTRQDVKDFLALGKRFF